MKKMKKLLIYALIIAALWIFSDIVIFMSIKGTYKTMDTRVNVSSPEVTISESKATYINGVIAGSIKNNTNKTIDDMYLKIDMYSIRDNNLGTKYIKINDLKANESQEFEMGYKITDVNYVTVTTTKDVKNATENEFVSEYVNFYILVGSLFALYLIL